MRAKMIVIAGMVPACTVIEPGLLGPDTGTAPDCKTNLECTQRFTGLDNSPSPVAGVCVQPAGRCTRLASDDCSVVTGDYTDNRAIVIGSLFETNSGNAGLSLIAGLRQNSVAIAVDEFNAVGGIPGATSGVLRPLVLVACGSAQNLLRAGAHLVNDLHVPAIVGPTTSQDTITLTQQVTAPGGAVLITPTAAASSVADLDDDGLTFEMIPNDAQQGIMLIRQIHDLEQQIKVATGKAAIKLAIVFRNDAIGVGTRVSLNALTLNGSPIASAANAPNVRIDAVAPDAPDLGALARAYVGFLPDIVVLAGVSEVAKLVAPLEAMWPTGPAAPYYLGINSTKVGDLLTSVMGNDGLRQRIRGVGITTIGASADTYSAFVLDYEARYPGQPATVAGMGSSYDAAYAIGLALGATGDGLPTGRTVAQALQQLSGGQTRIQIGPTKILAAFQRLTKQDSIDATGTFAPLRWNRDGSILGGTVEAWCVGLVNAAPVFDSSGLFYDVGTATYSGQYTMCPP